jgi:hypothetical protein
MKFKSYKIVNTCLMIGNNADPGGPKHKDPTDPKHWKRQQEIKWENQKRSKAGGGD